MLESSRRRIALLCAQVPPEIIAACGLEPFVITGREDAAPDPRLPQNLCPLVRRAATLLRAGAPAQPAGIVLADSCYPMLQLYELLQAGRAGGEVLLLRVPRRRDPGAVLFFREELARLARSLADLGGRFPDDQSLAAASEVAARRRQARSSCGAALLEGFIPALTPELLRSLAEGAPPPAACAASEAASDSRPRPRLLLAGSCFVSGELLRLLGDFGAAVVAVDACGYTRPGSGESAVATGIDPWAALAEAWLTRPPCPREQQAGSRVEAVVALAGRGSIDAVLYLRTACCTPQGYDLALWRRRLQAAGVPFYALETDGSAWSQPRLATRLEAFVESLTRVYRARPAAG